LPRASGHPIVALSDNSTLAFGSEREDSAI
jgi:hypothetical protein